MNEFEQKLKLAEAMARKGHLSRRDFIQLAAAAGIAIPMASTMFSKTQAAEPKKGGTLRIGMEGGSASDSLDPRTYADSIPISYSRQIWNNLVEIDGNGDTQ